MSDERSDRLRDRRQRTAKKAKPVKRDTSDNPDKPAESDKPVKPDNPDKSDKSDKPDNPVKPVKQRDDWGPKQIHLPERLENELDILLDETNATLRREGHPPLEKLMHWYPVIVECGLQKVAEMDTTELRERAEGFQDDCGGN